MDKEKLIKEKERILQEIELLEHERFQKGLEIDNLNKDISKMSQKLLEINEKLFD